MEDEAPYSQHARRMAGIIVLVVLALAVPFSVFLAQQQQQTQQNAEMLSPNPSITSLDTPVSSNTVSTTTVPTVSVALTLSPTQILPTVYCLGFCPTVRPSAGQ